MSSEFTAGMIFHEEVALTPELVEAFATFSGDRNPLHLKREAALAFGYAHPVAHGAIQSAIVSRLIGMQVPGEGAVWMNQNMEWIKPAFVGDVLRVEAEIESISPGAEIMSLLLRASNQNGERLMQGSAKVKIAAPIAERQDLREKKQTRVALVTGGSRGIGAAVVRALAAAGCTVVVAYKSDRQRATDLKNEMEKLGVQSSCIAVDLTQEGSGTALVAEVERLHGRLDILVHAATQPLPGDTVLNTTAADLRLCLRMQAEVALELAQAAAPGMIARKHGRMIFLGTSYLFGQPPAKLSAYVTAKEALWGLVRCLATELGPQQVTVNMVSPGMTVTDLTSNIPQRLKEVEARKTPLRRLALPDDTAGMVAFLAGNEAGYINGQNLALTGGPV